MATPKPETTIQRAIQKALKTRGAYVEKIHGSAEQSSMLDLVVCYRGYFCALEVKVPGDPATPRQAKIIRDVAHAGGRSSVVYSVEDAMRVLDVLEREWKHWDIARCLTTQEMEQVAMICRSMTGNQLQELVRLVTSPPPLGLGGPDTSATRL